MPELPTRSNLPTNPQSPCRSETGAPNSPKWLGFRHLCYHATALGVQRHDYESCVSLDQTEPITGPLPFGGCTEKCTWFKGLDVQSMPRIHRCPSWCYHYVGGPSGNLCASVAVNPRTLTRSIGQPRECILLSKHHPVALGLASCPWLRTSDKKPTG